MGRWEVADGFNLNKAPPFLCVFFKLRAAALRNICLLMIYLDQNSQHCCATSIYESAVLGSCTGSLFLLLTSAPIMICFPLTINNI